MPKVLVLFAGTESPAASLAENVAAAARSVRFTEVDIRAAAAYEATTDSRHKVLESADAVEQYDGVVVVSSTASVPSAITSLLDACDRTSESTFANTVFGVAGSENALLLERIARLGGIIVTDSRGDADAGRIGVRVAKVVEWVRHALSHEHGHHHHHHAH
jgi:NAD(P)H-dependent FMN reductase